MTLKEMNSSLSPYFKCTSNCLEGKVFCYSCVKNKLNF